MRRADCSTPGIRRVRRGKSFSYVTAYGQRPADADLDRIAQLVIPPAWTDVWICTDELGHLQATGVDGAGRKQYLYHPRWREQRDRKKFEHMEAFALALPQLRRRIGEDLTQTPELSREQLLACAVRLLDLGLFRIGGEEYAESGGSHGLATLHREHVTISGGVALFDYPAKSGVQRVHEVSDGDCVTVLQQLRRRRGGTPELLAYRSGRRWQPLHSDEITNYLKRQIGEEFSAKDFRTWNATVLASVSLAAAAARADKQGRQPSKQRVISRVAKDVSEVLGNTPSVARKSYIDPRVIDRYLSGWTIDSGLVGTLGDGLKLVAQASERRRRQLELAVLDLLDRVEESPKIEIHEE